MPILTDRCGAARVSPPADPEKGSSAIARTARALVQYLLFQECLDLGQRALLGLPGDVICAGQRNLRHRGRLHGQRAEVLGLEAVHIGFAAGPREHLRLDGQRVQEVVDALGRLVDLESLAQFGVLSGDADRAPPGVTVVTLPGRDADGALVVGDPWDVLVAVERHQRGVPDGHRFRAERQALGDVGAVADAAGHHQVDLIYQAHVLQRPACLRNGRHQRDAGLLRGDVRSRAGAALRAVQVDGVRTAFGSHPDVVVDAGGAQLELDRYLVVGRLADFLDLQRQVVWPEPVRVARRAPLVDAGWQRAHLGDLLGDLLPHQVTAEANLAALPDEELHPV